MLVPSGDGSGVTDTAALQAAIDANAGASLELSAPGTTPFQLNRPLVIPSAGITIQGRGWSRGGAPTVRQAPGANLRPPGLEELTPRGVWSPTEAYRVGDLVHIPVARDGEAYPGTRVRGDFAAGSAYAVNDVVINPADGGVYLCSAALNAVMTPDGDCFGVALPFHWIHAATELWHLRTPGSTKPPPEPGSGWAQVPRAGLFTSSAYLTETGWGDQPFRIVNLALDGNRAENPYSSACGVLAIAFWSDISDNYIHDMPGDGIVLADRTVSGSPVSRTGSMPSLRANFLSETSGHGIFQQSAEGNNLDGWCTGNAVQNALKSALSWEASAGWYITDNHVFGVGWQAIACGRMYATQVRGNYVESFGDQGAPDAWYAGISGSVESGAPSYVKDNVVRGYEPAWNAVGGFQYVALSAQNDSGEAGVVYVDGNDTGPWDRHHGSSLGTGLVLQSPQSGNNLIAYTGANRSAGAHAEAYFGAAGGATLDIVPSGPQRVGIAALSRGVSALVDCTSLGPDAVIRLTYQRAGATPGILTATVTPWRGFTIQSSCETDEGTVYWEILRY